MKVVDMIAAILLVLAGLTWGGVGVADFNPIMWTFISMPHVTHFIYIAFGVAAAWRVLRYLSRKCQKMR